MVINRIEDSKVGIFLFLMAQLVQLATDRAQEYSSLEFVGIFVLYFNLNFN